jgi:hypothetical protein
MDVYEYGRIGKLAESLEMHQVDAGIVDQIMQGGENIRNNSKPEAKADWLRTAMLRMDELLEANMRHAVREACACCLGGKRLKVSKQIARDHDTLQERIEAANQARFVFGHSVRLQDDGTVVVCFFDEADGQTYRCPCLPHAKEPLPITYCYCCGGHVKHHLQTALGRPMQVEVISSALSSGGTQPCKFLFTLNEQ